METSKQVLGTEHPDTLTAMANLAATYRNQGVEGGRGAGSGGHGNKQAGAGH